MFGLVRFCHLFRGILTIFDHFRPFSITAIYCDFTVISVLKIIAEFTAFFKSLKSMHTVISVILTAISILASDHVFEYDWSPVPDVLILYNICVLSCDYILLYEAVYAI